MNDQTLGLYLHIPFCKSKCIYCDFYSLPHSEEQMDRYTAALCRHVAEMAPRCAEMTVDTVYFGGGTPSYLGAERLAQLLKTVLNHYRVAPDAEITLEANPDSIGTLAQVQKLRAAGFNRISLGVQTCDDGLLRTIGRIHTFAQVEEAVRCIRGAGFDNLSLDLIYGLPGQTMSHWAATLEKAAALNPEHMSCYGLKVEEGTPLWNLRDKLPLPDDDLQADMYLHTVRWLEEAGYCQYEISNFARAGRDSRHNMRYWVLQPYAGFGPGAHSDFGGERYAFVRDLAAYCRGVEEGGDVFSERESVSPDERALEYLMLGLRTVRGIGEDEFEARFGRSFAPIRAVLAPLAKRGLAVEQQGRWHLTPEGFLLSNAIIGSVLETQE